MQTVVTPEKTEGTSPKTILAAALPAIASLLAVVIQWAVTGELNQPELLTALTGLSASILAGVGAFLGHPGTVVVDLSQGSQGTSDAPADLGVASDDLLPAEVKERLSGPASPDLR